LCARAMANRSGIGRCSANAVPAANVENTSWRWKPSWSSAVERSSRLNAPSAK
jgi:hypothetical protein